MNETLYHILINNKLCKNEIMRVKMSHAPATVATDNFDRWVNANFPFITGIKSGDKWVTAEQYLA